MRTKSDDGRRHSPSDDRSTAWLCEELRKAIIERRLAPGSRINQSKLARSWNVSRTPIVNALHKLETQGLVDSVPRKGFYVHKLSILELLDLFALREALDTIIVAELTETISEQQLAQLTKVFESFDGSVDGIEAHAYWKADRTFHTLLLRFSTNNLAKKINATFQIFDRAFVGGLLREPAETLVEHREIIRALRDKDREAAARAMTAHVAKTRMYLQDVVNRMRKLGIDPAVIPVNELQGRPG